MRVCARARIFLCTTLTIATHFCGLHFIKLGYWWCYRYFCGNIYTFLCRAREEGRCEKKVTLWYRMERGEFENNNHNREYERWRRWTKWNDLTSDDRRKCAFFLSFSRTAQRKSPKWEGKKCLADDRDFSLNNIRVFVWHTENTVYERNMCTNIKFAQAIKVVKIIIISHRRVRCCVLDDCCFVYVRGTINLGREERMGEIESKPSRKYLSFSFAPTYTLSTASNSLLLPVPLSPTIPCVLYEKYAHYLLFTDGRVTKNTHTHTHHVYAMKW